MFECTLQNIMTGRTISYYSRTDHLRESLGHTAHIRGTNDPHIISSIKQTHSSVVPTDDNRTNSLIESISTITEYGIVVVSFPNNTKGYEYYYKYSDFPYAVGDKVEIKTPLSGSAEVIIYDFRSSFLKHKATKLIQVVAPMKYLTTVQYVNNNSLSDKKYEYLVDEKIKPFQFKMIQPNSALVYVVGSKEYNGNKTTSDIILSKSFTDPNMDNLSLKLSAEEPLTGEMRQAIEIADTTNLDNCCKAFFESFEDTNQSQNNLTLNDCTTSAVNHCTSYCNTPSGLTISDALKSWTSSSQPIRNSIYQLNKEITPIAQLTPSYYDSYRGTQADNNNKGDEKTMNTNKLFKNFEFGKITDKLIKMTMCGLAFMQNDGSYVTYNTTTNELTDVSAFIMEDFDCVFAMPVAIKGIKENDVIKHNNKYVFVKEIDLERNNILAVDPLAGEEKIIIPTKNMFGFNYYTKIVNLFGGFSATEEMPFGNMLPFFLMREGGSNDALMLAMMMQNGDKTADFMSNPLMMMALLNK